MKSFIISICMAMGLLIISAVAHAQSNFSGTYTMSSEGTTLTLTIQEDQQTNLVGTLTSNVGASFKIEGQVMEDVGTGMCYNQEAAVYFETFFEGGQLVLTLIEIDEYNMPDYNTMRYLYFAKQGTAGYAQQQPPVQQQQQAPVSQQPSGNQQTGQVQQPTTQAKFPSSVNLSGKVLKEPSWGFQFAVPEGWVSQQSADGAILGHNTIAGMILVLPHQIKNIQSLHQELAGGLQDEGVSLMVSGSLQQIGNNALAGEYSGYIQGEQAKAWGVGTLSPYGGGAYIIAATTPEKYGKEIKSAADAIAANMQYFKPEVSDVMRHFVGKWVTTTGSTTDNMYLYPDGTYSDYYEASYSGNFSDGSGDVTGNWGTANQESNRGRWTVKGDKDSGRIIVTYPNGNQSVYNYRVHVERGEYYYNEYNINGRHYWKTALE